jgi:hypothetical protein
MTDDEKPEGGQAIPVDNRAECFEKRITICTRYVPLKRISDQESLCLRYGSVQHLVSAIARHIVGMRVWKPAFPVRLRK